MTVTTADPKFEALIAAKHVLGVRQWIGNECWDPDCPYCPRLRELMAELDSNTDRIQEGE